MRRTGKPVSRRKSPAWLEKAIVTVMRKTGTRREWGRSPYVGPDNPNDKGDWVEMVFMTRATALGLIVSRPYGAESFDFVVCPRKGPLSRVQVKSVWTMRDRMYRVRTCGTHGRRYRRGEVDFIVAYVVPEDAWYVIPLSEISYRMAYLSPHIAGSRARWEKYREAWGMLGARRR